MAAHLGCHTGHHGKQHGWGWQNGRISNQQTDEQKTAAGARLTEWNRSAVARKMASDRMKARHKAGFKSRQGTDGRYIKKD